VRLAFFGTPADAVPALEVLHEAGHEISLVVTQPDKRRGRGVSTAPSPVREAAERLGLPVRTPARSREVVDEMRETGAEIGVVVAFGQLLPPELLDAVPLGFVNVHFSLLPRWRGAAPVERAILAGDTETGVCIMRLEEGLDTGPVYASERTPIGPDESAGDLRARLVDLGTHLLVRTLSDVAALEPEPQRGEPTYATKLTVEEFQLDPRARLATELARIVRAGNPRPGAWITVAGHRVKVWRVGVENGDGAPGALIRPRHLATAEGLLSLDEVQVEGKRTMAGDAWMNGLRADVLQVDAP
jgi:methionyl-tRNA formyltransferase